MSERVVIVLEYEADPYNEQWFIDVVRPLKESQITKPARIYLAIKDHAEQVIAIFDDTMPENASTE